MAILRKISILWLVLIILFEVLVLVYILDYFQIKYITTPHFFSPLLYEQGGKNLLRFDAEALATKIGEGNPKIKNVTVQKKIPSTLVVQFETRKPFLLATDRYQHARFLVDDTGVVFATAKDSMRFPLVITGRISLKEGVVLVDPTEKTALKIVEIVEETNLELDRLMIKENQILLEIDSIEVILGTDNVNLIKVKALQFLVKRFTIEGKKPNKIDLRFEKPIVTF